MGLSETPESLRRTGFYRDSPRSGYSDRWIDVDKSHEEVARFCELLNHPCFDAPTRDAAPVRAPVIHFLVPLNKIHSS
jgi:hypothetical protein